MKKDEEIKAVEMVRRIRDRHYELLKDATREERMAFYNRSVQASKKGIEMQPEKETTTK